MLGKIVYLWCDTCHVIGPTDDSRKSVQQAARKLGWFIGKPTQQHPHTTPALCPTCKMVHALVVAP